MRGQSLVHPALLGHDWDGTGGRFWENDLSDEDSTKADSRGHQAENEVQGTEFHRSKTGFAVQLVIDGDLCCSVCWSPYLMLLCRGSTKESGIK